MIFCLIDVLIAICVIILIILAIWFLISRCRQPSYKTPQCECKESYVTSGNSNNGASNKYGFVLSWFQAITGANLE